MLNSASLQFSTLAAGWQMVLRRERQGEDIGPVLERWVKALEAILALETPMDSSTTKETSDCIEAAMVLMPKVSPSYRESLDVSLRDLQHKLFLSKEKIR